MSDHALYDKTDDCGRDWPLLMVQVCYNCEYLQTVLGKYSSRGPKCAECGDELTTYEIIG